MGKLTFYLKQLFKMTTQNVILPLAYRFWSLVMRNEKKEQIVFADAHHDEIPFSMKRLHEKLEEKGYRLTDVFCDYGRMSAAGSFFAAMKFMKVYAVASHVFICDNFLSVSSCKKQKDTMVVQLWHGCALKKTGYDAEDDIPPYYAGEVFKNYDLLPVSAAYAVEPFTHGMHLEKGVAKPLGISRMDYYFDPEWSARCRENFRKRYPNANGKKVILWAPSFRGNAGHPYQEGEEAMDALEKELGDSWFLIKKMHPHVQRQRKEPDFAFTTEELFPVADLLITDYSSVMFDFSIQNRPFLLFAPDLSEYRKNRGFYVDYESLCPYIVTDSGQLADTVRAVVSTDNSGWLREFRQKYVSACDGHATERIMEYIGL
ncbi:MAG: CDP-glycerol glycerophosphotransferase family protein [Lachnospiraceae bacterium]|nr:CDP-glycerol glycerophosphotransferase family protein [Lachnospiraceae bacterium]